MFAAITGKVAGIIVEASTNSPLPGANVIIEGTYLGAATNEDGYYSILNIPPGVYNLNVTMMGYKKVIEGATTIEEATRVTSMGA